MKKVFINVVCCSCDWRSRVKKHIDHNHGVRIPALTRSLMPSKVGADMILADFRSLEYQMVRSNLESAVCFSLVWPRKNVLIFFSYFRLSVYLKMM